MIHECDAFGLLLETVRELASKYPERRIRLRVHPSENLAAYQTGGNIVLDTSNSFVEALQNTAPLVFISGCSTGIEAFMAGVPAVRLGTGGHGLSCDLHIGASTAAEALQAVEKQLREPKMLGDVFEHFAPLTLAQKIAALQTSNSASETDDAEGHLRKTIDQDFKPDDAMRTKFPEISEEQIRAMTNASRIKPIGWNTWFLS